LLFLGSAGKKPTGKTLFNGKNLEGCQGNTIRHFVNGEEILQFENPGFNPAHPIGKTFIINGDDKVKEGYISLQSNSHPMDFRTIEIMEY